MAVHFRAEGTLLVAGDPSDRAATDRMLAFHQAMGLPALRLGVQACREAEPLLAPGISGGVELPDDHQVDNRAVATALVAACRAASVTMVADRVVRIEVDGGQARGVTRGGRPTGRRLRRGAGRRAAGRATSTGYPTPGALRSDRSGGPPSGSRPQPASPGCGARCGHSSTGGRATWCPVTTGVSCSEPPWRNGVRPSTYPSAASPTSSRTPDGSSPPWTSTRCSR